MDKYIVFGSKLWPDCPEVEEFLSRNNIKYAYIDITASMFNLKQFFKYRDNYPAFRYAREKGLIGIPILVVNNGEEVTFKIKNYFIEKLGLPSE